MSRRSSESLRKNLLTMRERSSSPRTSVYDRLGPPGSHVLESLKIEETYLLKNGHCRFGDECSFDHGPIAVILSNGNNNTHDGPIALNSPIVGSDNGYLEKCNQNESHIDGKVSSSNLIDRRSAEISQIKDSIRRHISRSSKLRNSESSKNIEIAIKKNTRSQMQMGSVVHRGSKNTKVGSIDGRVVNNISYRIQPATKESINLDLSLDREPSITSDSCYSGDERDSSTDSISENDGVIQEIKIFGTKSREKALSSISESSFSSVPSTDRKVSGKKKRSLLITNHKLEGVKDTIFDHKMNRDTSLSVTKFDNLDMHMKSHDKIGKIDSSKDFQFNSHKFSKKNCKRKSYSHSEEGIKFKKEHNKDKKRIAKSNTGPRIDSKRSNLLCKTKADNNKKIRLIMKVKSKDDVPENCDSNSFVHSIIKENICPLPKPKAKNNTIYHQNETKIELSTNNRSELSNSEGIYYRIHDTHFNNLNNFEMNKSVEIECPKPQLNCDVSDISTKSENQDKSVDVVLPSTNSENCKVVDNLSLKIHLKRKQNRKLSDNIEKKKKKNEDSVNNIYVRSNPSKNVKYHKDKTFGSTNVISRSLSPVSIIKDGFEIYDSLSDLEQGIILDEDICTDVSNKFTIDSHVVGIKCPSVDVLQSSNHTNCVVTLLSQLGISYSLLDSDTFIKCIDIILNDIPIHCNIPIRSYLQELSFGSFIEDFLSLEREKLLINLNTLQKYTLIKNSDIQFRKFISGFRNIINLNSVSLSTNPQTSRELFKTAVSIYHNLGLLKSI